MPKTLLAIDDSATMRKVLEITFAGEDFRVVSADTASGALARLGDEPAVAVIDSSLGGDDCYALAKDIRARNSRVALVLMSSRYSPYDANRGREAGIDDFVDKPFDTQVLIDKVKKAIAARDVARAAAAAAPPPTPPPYAPPAAPAPTPPVASPAVNVTAPFGAPRPPAPATSVGAGKAANWPTQRTHTLSFEGPLLGGAGAPGTPQTHQPIARTSPSGGAMAPAPPQAALTAAPTAAPPSSPNPLTVPVESHRPSGATRIAPPMAAGPTNGLLAKNLDALGLTGDQVRAVLALSRELVERVVWEVVPQLAEAIIKEEIARLTREG